MRSLAVLFVLAVVATACSSPVPTATPVQPPVGGYAGWPPNVTSELVPILASTELVVGDNRFLSTVVDQHNEPLAAADLPVQLRFYNLAADPATPEIDTPGVFLPRPQGPGLYRANVTFDAAGDWGLETITTEPDGTHRSGRVVFSVLEQGSTPAIGAAAPTSQTPTATTPAEIAKISTDTAPDPAFYKTSEPDALAAKKPFVIIFATPAFCRTATCGPTLNIVKSVAADYEDRLTFIHVEPYKLQTVSGQLQPVLNDKNEPIVVDATNIWRLQTEPYTFVVDGSGKVTAKFEGIASEEELRAAFDNVLK